MDCDASGSRRTARPTASHHSEAALQQRRTSRLRWRRCSSDAPPARSLLRPSLCAAEVSAFQSLRCWFCACFSGPGRQIRVTAADGAIVDYVQGLSIIDGGARPTSALEGQSAGIRSTTVNRMPEMTSPLPKQDMLALFDVVVVFAGEVLAGQVSPHLTAHIVRRLAKDGLIAEDASVGELGATIDDLIQRMRYALGEYPALPEPSRRETTYILSVPSYEAARACQDKLATRGGSDVTVRETEEHRWEVLATFPELAPDPSHEARFAEMRELAVQYGGRVEGWQR